MDYDFREFPNIYIFLIKTTSLIFWYFHAALCTDIFYSSVTQTDLLSQNSDHKNIFYGHSNLFRVLFAMLITFKKMYFRMLYFEVLQGASK